MIPNSFRRHHWLTALKRRYKISGYKYILELDHFYSRSNFSWNLGKKDSWQLQHRTLNAVNADSSVWKTSHVITYIDMWKRCIDVDTEIGINGNTETITSDGQIIRLLVLLNNCFDICQILDNIQHTNIKTAPTLTIHDRPQQSVYPYNGWLTLPAPPDTPLLSWGWDGWPEFIPSGHPSNFLELGWIVVVGDPMDRVGGKLYGPLHGIWGRWAAVFSHQISYHISVLLVATTVVLNIWWF